MAFFDSSLPLSNRIIAFLEPKVSTNSRALWRASEVFSRSNISILFLTPKIKGFADGCRLDFTNPKCAPTEKSSSTMLFSLLCVCSIREVYLSKPASLTQLALVVAKSPTHTSSETQTFPAKSLLCPLPPQFFQKLGRDVDVPKKCMWKILLSAIFFNQFSMLKCFNTFKLHIHLSYAIAYDRCM